MGLFDSTNKQTVTTNERGSTSSAQANQFNQAQSQTQGLDPNSQAYVDWQRNLAQQGAGAMTGGGPLALGPNAGMLAALQQMSAGGGSGGAMAGLQGAQSLMSQLMDPATLEKSIGTFMNPYNKNVVDATRGEFDFMRSMASRDARGVPEGVFGGDRAALLEGSRLGELDRGQGSTIAELQRSGYDTALNAAMQDRAQQAQGLGSLGGAFAGMSAQDMQRQQMLFDNWNTLRGVEEGALGGNQDMRRFGSALQFANMGMGPTGSVSEGTQTGSSSGTQSDSFNRSGKNTTTTKTGGSLFGNLAGIAGTVLGGPLGGMIGKGVAGLFGGGAPQVGAVASGMADPSIMRSGGSSYGGFYAPRGPLAVGNTAQYLPPR